MRKCKNCGKDISEYAVVCPNCGCAVNAPGNGEKTIYTKPKRSRKKYVVVAVAAVVLLILSGFIFACAQNAYNCVIGKDPIGLGVILFEEAILNFDLRPIVTAKIGSMMAVILCVAVITVCFLMVWQIRQKHENLT